MKLVAIVAAPIQPLKIAANEADVVSDDVELMAFAWARSDIFEDLAFGDCEAASAIWIPLALKRHPSIRAVIVAPTNKDVSMVISDKLMNDVLPPPSPVADSITLEVTLASWFR
jgi:hypothetical protein